MYNVLMKNKHGKKNTHVPFTFVVKAAELRYPSTPRRANDCALRLFPGAKVIMVRDVASGRAVA